MKTASYTAIAAAGIALLVSTPAFAEIMTYKADLTAEQAGTDSTATGTSDITFDTESMTLNWSITYEGLTGEATAAHFHGPAAMGANAGPALPIEGALVSPISGEAILTEAQASDLEAGMWYFNIHTAKFPDGEIRGQVVAADAM